MRNMRPILRLLVYASLGTFALALCVVGARTQTTPQTVVVTITPANPPTVSVDPAQISKSAGDQVEWVCPQCTSGFQVHFPQTSPFASSTFGPQNEKSGRVSANAALGLYNYTVTVNGNTADPGVKVNQ